MLTIWLTYIMGMSGLGRVVYIGTGVGPSLLLWLCRKLCPGINGLVKVTQQQAIQGTNVKKNTQDFVHFWEMCL